MRKVSHWTLAALGALCLSGSAALPLAAADPATEIPLHNMASDACLSHNQGAVIGLDECQTGTPTQGWAREDLGNGTELLWVPATDECLTHTGDSSVRLTPCDANAEAQQWQVEPANAGNLLRHPATDSCLGHLGGSDVQLFPCEPDNPAQQWILAEN